jgi:hypothetical protein
MLVSNSDAIAFHPDSLQCLLELPFAGDFQSLFCSLDLHLGHPESSNEFDILLFWYFVDLILQFDIDVLLVGLSETIVAIAGAHHNNLLLEASLDEWRATVLPWALEMVIEEPEPESDHDSLIHNATPHIKRSI